MASIPSERVICSSRWPTTCPGPSKYVGRASALSDEEPVARWVSPESALRFSLAGLVLKSSVVEREQRVVMPATGAGTRWIAKFPDRPMPNPEGVVHVDRPRHEFVVMELARLSGLAVARTKRFDVAAVDLPPGVAFPERTVFAAERFDRDPDGGRIHQEDFAQVLGRAPHDKYDQYATSTLSAKLHALGRIVHAVCGPADFDEFLRRTVFNLLVGNSDAHLKNWSLVYPDRRTARLSPAYDLNATVAYGYDPELALKLYKKTSPTEVYPVDFQRLAADARADVGRAKEVVAETVARFRVAWSALADDLPPVGARARVEAHLRGLPLWTLTP